MPLEPIRFCYCQLLHSFVYINRVKKIIEKITFHEPECLTICLRREMFYNKSYYKHCVAQLTIIFSNWHVNIYKITYNIDTKASKHIWTIPVNKYRVQLKILAMYETTIFLFIQYQWLIRPYNFNIIKFITFLSGCKGRVQCLYKINSGTGTSISLKLCK